MMPLVVGLIFGLIFISVLFYSYVTLQAAVRDGAHQIVTNGKNESVATITTLVQNSIFALGGVTVGISPSQADWTTPRILVTVVATYTVQFAQLSIPFPGGPPTRLGPLTIHAQSNMWTE